MKNFPLHLAFFMVFFLAAGNGFSQAPAWLWAKSNGGPNNEMGTSVATDAAGNAYVAGYFQSPSLVFGSFTLTRTGNSNVFLAKYSASGNVLWAVSATGSDSDQPFAVATDPQGNVVVAGYFSSPVITFGGVSLTNAGVEDAFVVKYDLNGNVIWAKRAGGADWDNARALAVDGNGNIYLAGSFRSPSITFGSFTLTNTAAGMYDGFLVKYDAGGSVVWARSAGGPGNNDPISVATDQSGNVFMAGGFTGATMTFGSITVTNHGLDDLFIARYDASGNVIWAESAGGTREDDCYSVATDGSGNAYINGLFRSETISFGTNVITNFAGSYHTSDVFIAKYDSSGNVLWAADAGGPQDDQGISLTTDAAGNIYCTGVFLSDTAHFGSTTLVNTNYHSDLFLVKYSPAGVVLWALRAGGTDNENWSSVALDATGNLFMTGIFESPVITFGSDTLYNAGGGDLFLAKLDGNITGIGKNNISPHLSIFPNPAVNRIAIDLPAGTTSGTMTVYNPEGVPILKYEVTGPVCRVDVNNLPTGLYTVRLVSNEGVTVGKFIKK